MEVIFILIGISIVMASSFLWLFIRAMRSGQYDDTYTPSIRILFDQKVKTKVKEVPSTKTK